MLSHGRNVVQSVGPSPRGRGNVGRPAGGPGETTAHATRPGDRDRPGRRAPHRVLGRGSWRLQTGPGCRRRVSPAGPSHSNKDMTMSSKKRGSRDVSKSQFAPALRERARAAGRIRPAEYDEPTFSLVGPGTHPKVAYLGNTYAEFLTPPSKRDEILRRYLRHWFKLGTILPLEYADARPDILPGIRSRLFTETIGLENQIRGLPPGDHLGRPLAEGLDVWLVFNSPGAMCGIPAQLSPTGASASRQVLDDALENLREEPRRLSTALAGIWRSPWSDSYDAARLLLTETDRRDASQGRSRGFSPQLRYSARHRQRRRRGPPSPGSPVRPGVCPGRRPITPVPFRLSGGIWTPFSPPRDHPCYQTFRQLELTTLLSRNTMSRASCWSNSEKQPGTVPS